MSHPGIFNFLLPSGKNSPPQFYKKPLELEGPVIRMGGIKQPVGYSQIFETN